MAIGYETYRRISMLIDEDKNLVIFPQSVSYGIETEEQKGVPYIALYPIELKYPYSAEELSDKIKEGLDEWDKHKCYGNFSGRNTFEEKYYGIKGFKNAVKGKKLIELLWTPSPNKNITSLLIPMKRGYAYLGIKSVKLADNADYIDYANVVIDLINTDFTSLKSYKVYKSKLNI